MAASLNDRGKMAVVLDTGAVSRGSGNQGSNRERDIRKVFVERDFVEAVVLLPENLFWKS
jgi:type I restriction enzyme M protein